MKLLLFFFWWCFNTVHFTVCIIIKGGQQELWENRERINMQQSSFKQLYDRRLWGHQETRIHCLDPSLVCFHCQIRSVCPLDPSTGYIHSYLSGPAEQDINNNITVVLWVKTSKHMGLLVWDYACSLCLLLSSIFTFFVFQLVRTPKKKSFRQEGEKRVKKILFSLTCWFF